MEKEVRFERCSERGIVLMRISDYRCGFQVFAEP